mmetsp:Transcript_71099/g.179938  ORF Transcript_71099/g.179938 Transcript_71099/m.179938 type:complete len:333 (-) Transcript_71099:34-1032(-)
MQHSQGDPHCITDRLRSFNFNLLDWYACCARGGPAAAACPADLAQKLRVDGLHGRADAGEVQRGDIHEKINQLLLGRLRHSLHKLVELRPVLEPGNHAVLALVVHEPCRDADRNRPQREVHNGACRRDGAGEIGVRVRGRVVLREPEHLGAEQDEDRVHANVEPRQEMVPPWLEDRDRDLVHTCDEAHPQNLRHALLEETLAHVHENDFGQERQTPPPTLLAVLQEQELPPCPEFCAGVLLRRLDDRPSHDRAEPSHIDHAGKDCSDSHACPGVAAAQEALVCSQCVFSIWVGVALERDEAHCDNRRKQREDEREHSIEERVEVHPCTGSRF